MVSSLESITAWCFSKLWSHSASQSKVTLWLTDHSNLSLPKKMEHCWCMQLKAKQRTGSEFQTQVSLTSSRDHWLYICFLQTHCCLVRCTKVLLIININIHFSVDWAWLRQNKSSKNPRKQTVSESLSPAGTDSGQTTAVWVWWGSRLLALWFYWVIRLSHGPKAPNRVLIPVKHLQSPQLLQSNTGCN